jgi:hypothetical protein
MRIMASRLSWRVGAPWQFTWIATALVFDGTANPLQSTRKTS